MSHNKLLTVAIIDYGMGNLFSVKHACEHVGLDVKITSSKEDVLLSDIVILPGVGAFGNAMKALKRLDLVRVIHDIALSDKILIGICLGMQLLMSESSEFGHHKGLDIIKGTTKKLELQKSSEEGVLKVPQVGWNRIFNKNKDGDVYSWEGSLLNNQVNGEFMYFTHSYYVEPDNKNLTLAISRYEDIEFCSALRYKNISAFQFHPERSGIKGLDIYRSLILKADHGKKEKKCQKQ